ncbi:MAG: esterase-like activity of phytase family protein [Planctomycetota bacterium]|nr:esterase-like activity of phytase family protein [Planctomycetota bacterium]
MSIFLILATLWNSTQQFEVQLLGKTSIPGTASDLSNMKNLLEDKSPNNRLGGFGSAIAYTGQGNKYLLLPDRGPGDGANSYSCRFHLAEITVLTQGKIDFKLLKTTLLKTPEGNPLTGLSKGFGPLGNRFDPEGIRVLKNGSILISDEYGPSVWLFDSTGKLKHKFLIPEKFLIQNKSDDAEKEFPPFNKKGRVTNKGFEGIAISSDQKKWIAALQGSLIQDRNPSNSDLKTNGENLRFLETSIEGKHLREIVYKMESAKNGVNEILAIGEEDYLVLERDSDAGESAGFKKIFRISTKNVTDVSKILELPSSKLPEGIVPVSKNLYLDLLDPKFGLKGKDFPAKIEGLAFGPDLPDGRKLLIITTDNDFKPEEPTWIYAFAVKID